MTVPPIPPVNQAVAEAEGKYGFGKIVAAFLSSIITTYVMNQFSLHGVNFEADMPGVTISSELVKAAIDAQVVTFFVWFTPKHFVASVKDAIIWVRCTLRTWRSALSGDLPPQQ